MDNLELGWVTLEVECPGCGHTWAIVAPMDVEVVVCSACNLAIDAVELAGFCAYCSRVLDDTVTGDAPCPCCGQPRILDERAWN